MTVSNREIRQAARQVFASSRAIVTPFYNRAESRQEMGELFANREELRATAVIVSSPVGTGKTFFIDQVGSDLSIAGREKPLLVRQITDSNLKRDRGDVLFVDEADIKTTWDNLVRGLTAVGRHLATSGQIGLLLGDFVLRNPDLLALLPASIFLRHFEPLDRAFLEGVIRQRVQTYLEARNGEQIIEPELYDVLAPDGTARVNSFRTILSFLEGLTRVLPHNSAPCRLTLDMAIQRATETIDPDFSTERQSNFLDLFLDYLADNHPRGSGLENGLDREAMFSLGYEAGYSTWDAFEDEIIQPFGDQDLIVSRGIPALNERGEFVRWVEPFYPSLHVMLLAQAPTIASR